MRVSGSFSGSWRRAPAGALASRVSASPTAAQSSGRIALKADKALFPVLDLELRLLAALPVVDLQLEIFRSNAFLEFDGGATLVVALVRPLAAEEGDQLVLADLQIAQIEPVHAALEQRIDLTRSVKIVDDLLLIDLQRDRVEREEIAYVHGKENGHLRVGGEQQLLFQHEEIAIQVDHVLLKPLHFLIQAAGIGLRFALWR